MRFIYALALSFALAVPAMAQTVGSCETGRAEADLFVSDVFARLFNAGNLFFGRDTSSNDGYIVPQGSGNGPLYNANLWAGGTVDGELRTAGATFADFEFFPGPLTDRGELPDADDCSAFDRIYVLTALDVEQYETTGFAPADLRDWPVGQGAPAVDASGQPIVSSDIGRVLDLDAGERPLLSGSQTAFWVMNDVGGPKVNNGTAPLGIQVGVTAFSVISADPALSQTTVYRYAVTNKSPSTIDGFTAGFFTDFDLGEFGDNRTGVDTTRGLAFAYNAQEVDPRYGVPPAIGVDLLRDFAGASTFYRFGFDNDETRDPGTAEGYYNRLLGLWNDGTAITEGGDGYDTDGSVVSSTFPGDPVTQSFWSEENVDGAGTAINDHGSDIAYLAYAEAAPLAPGETRTVDLVIVFGQGADRLDSITELRAASDRVQAAYDAGTLFAPGPAPLRLATPVLLTPEDGADFTDLPITFDWADVPGAAEYLVDVSPDPAFPGGDVGRTLTVTESEAPFVPFVLNETAVAYWRVRARAPGALSFVSETRSFTYFAATPDFVGEGRGIVEVARPEGEVCPDGSDDWGCERDLGNTIWLDADVSGDYAVSADALPFGGGEPIERLREFVASLAPAAVEMRFTDGPNWGKRFNSNNGGQVWSVPFELWNVGTTPDDPSDDVRMIPFILNDSGVDFMWEDSFPREDPVFGLPATSRVYGMMPDRANGYELFAETASGIGAGNDYEDTDVTDTPIDEDNLFIGDIDPSTGEVCDNVGTYVSYCYRNTETSALPGAEGAGDDFVQVLSRLTIADLAGDGTTPPSGTTIRFLTTGNFIVAGDVFTFSTAELAAATNDAVAAEEALDLITAVPNPYLGSSAYESDNVDRVMRFTNIPDVATLRIFTVNGSLVRRIDKDGPSRSIDWDLTTENNLPVASGMYFVHVEIPGVGDRVLKVGVINRQTDVTIF